MNQVVEGGNYMTLTAFRHDNTIIKFHPKILLSFSINGHNRIYQMFIFKSNVN